MTGLIALIVGASGGASLGLLYRRRVLGGLLREIAAMQHSVARAAMDAPLAEWCRHMSVTVVAHSGAVFSSTFAELQASEAPLLRQWSIPVSVTIWSDLDHDFADHVPEPDRSGPDGEPGLPLGHGGDCTHG